MHIDARALGDSLARLRAEPHEADLTRALDRTVTFVDQLFGYDGAGIMLADQGEHLMYVAASDEVGRSLEQAQADAEQGPCYDAYAYARTISSKDLRSDARWPELSERLDGRIRAVAGAPIVLGDASVGTLNVYRTEPAGWDDSDLTALHAYADLVEEILTAELATRDHGETAAQLQQVLENRVMIERATGYVMGTHDLDQSTAASRLRDQAKDSGRRVADLAAELVGESSPAPPPAHAHPPAPPAKLSTRRSDRRGDRRGSRDTETETLLVEMNRQATDDPRRERIRSAIAELQTPIVKHVARRYAKRGEPVEDLEQAAYVGLVKAINRFDVTLGHSFSAYAMPLMTGEVKRHFRDRTWAVRPPRDLQESSLRLRSHVQEFTHRHRRSPTTAEIAEVMELSVEETIEVLTANEAYRTTSLDAPVASHEDADNQPTLGDQIGVEDTALDTLVDGHALAPLIDALPARNRKILLLRFFGNMTQSQIGQEIGISQMHVSRLLSQTISQLRTAMLSDAPPRARASTNTRSRAGR